jgi:hypothetical protein
MCCRWFSNLPSARKIYDVMWNEYLKDVSDPDMLYQRLVEVAGDILFISPTVHLALLHSSQWLEWFSVTKIITSFLEYSVVIVSIEPFRHVNKFWSCSIAAGTTHVQCNVLAHEVRGWGSPRVTFLSSLTKVYGSHFLTCRRTLYSRYSQVKIWHLSSSYWCAEQCAVLAMCFNENYVTVFSVVCQSQLN